MSGVAVCPEETFEFEPQLGVSKDSQIAWERFIEAVKHLHSTISSEVSIEERFNHLAALWETEVQNISSATEMAMHPAYQQIIGMGKQIIPLLLLRLAIRPHHWFWALRAITGENPVDSTQAGKVKAMADAWLKWGRKHGYRF